MTPGSHYEGTTRVVNRNPVWTGVLKQAPARIFNSPLRKAKPTTYFVNSMSDLFHENVPDEWIDRVFAIMALTPQHTYQILTKRAARMRAYFDGIEHRALCIGSELGNMLDGQWIWNEGKKFRPEIDRLIALSHGLMPDGESFADESFLPLKNVWLGVSCEDQTRADERIPDLLATPAAVRFISAEPLLAPIELFNWSHRKEMSKWLGKSLPIDWIIVGGESGPGARPMDIGWARSIVKQCKAAGIACFVKQLGAAPKKRWSEDPREGLAAIKLKDSKGGDWNEWPEDLRIREMPMAKEHA
jgi:protein gp37